MFDPPIRRSGLAQLARRACGVVVVAASCLVAAGTWTGQQQVEAVAATTVTCDDELQTSQPSPAPLASYQPIVPVRLVDTRIGTGGAEGAVPAGCTLRVSLAGSAVPDEAGAAALSVIAVSEQRGFLTVFPCASGRPLASNLNTRAEAPTPNLVVAVPDENHEICIFSVLESHVVVDLQGWWIDGPTRFRPIDPIRAYDSRELQPAMALEPGEIRPVRVAPDYVPENATSVVVNLTATETAADGWILAFPCGEVTPLASNLNYARGDTRAVAAIVGVGTRNGGKGEICLRSPVEAHVIVDVVGYYAPSPAFGPAINLQPVQQRLVDTRDETGPWDRPFRAGEVREIDPTVAVAGSDEAAAVVINAIGLNATAPGYLTFYPCSAEPPLVSTLNTVPLQEVTNLLTVELSDAGTLCVLSKSAGDVVLDLVGVMVVPPDSPVQELDVSGGEVWPAFTPSGSDYAIQCSDGTNVIRFDVVRHRGGDVRVGGEPLPSTGTVQVPLAADEVTTVEVTSPASESFRYHFRCLPTDFPQLSVQSISPEQVEAGWYLTDLGGQAGLGTFVVIMDERGAPVWYQRTPLRAVNAQRLADGTISFDPTEGRGYGAGADETARVIRLDGTSVENLTTDDPVGFPIDHHELLERPGGWTMLSYPLTTADVSVLGPGYCTTENVVGGSIREVSDTGELEWAWDMFDHFDIAESTFPVRFDNYPPRPDRGCPDGEPAPLLGEVDLFHINSLDRLDAAGGDYVVSARHLDAVFRVDRATGDVEWILSGEPTGDLVPNKNGALRLTVVDDPFGGPLRPHDARLDGNVLTLFDNRTATDEPARAVAYRIDVDPMSSTGTATLLWQIEEPLGRSSNGLGSLRVLPNGNRLVSWGGLQPMFNEFDVDGNLVLSIRQTLPGNAYRIVRYDVDAFDAAELRGSASSAGLPG